MAAVAPLSASLPALFTHRAGVDTERLAEAHVQAQESIDEMYRGGRLLDAWSALQAMPARERALPGRERLRAVERRLVHHLGAPKRSLRETFTYYRHNPREGYARVSVAYATLMSRGPLAAHEWLTAHPVDASSADDVLRAESFEISSDIFAGLRDFTTAREHLDRWRALDVSHGDYALCDAMLLMREHHLSRGIAVARAALEAEPGHRRLTMALASLLATNGEPKEAVLLLRRASDAMQCSAVTEMLAALALGCGEDDQVAHAVDHVLPLIPLAEPDVLATLRHMRAESLYRRGYRADALAQLEGIDDERCKRFARRLAAPDVRDRRKCLDVPFILQEHLGCAPATLAALSRFFGRPTDHIELADRICYHGTPAHAERSWAESHGFIARELRLTWETAVALLERDVPFVLSTFVPGNGHAQAVMGFDERRRALILRDPFVPVAIEVDADLLLEDMRHSGPRCLVVVPHDRVALLDGIDLPDADLYDVLHEVERGLHVHDRKVAAEAAARFDVIAPGHRLGRAARRALAAYDENPGAVLAVATEALAADAMNQIALLDRLVGMQSASPRSERLTAIEAAASKPNADPIFSEVLANELASDAREHARARRLCRRVLGARPESPRSVALLGQIAWNLGDGDRGLQLLRFAACLEPTNDDRVRQYAFAARKTGRYPEALAFIRARVEKLGARSSEPAVLLADALDELGEHAAANAVLDEAAALRPDDGALLLHRSRRAAVEGRGDEARSLLEAAKGKIDSVSWLRGAAILAATEGRNEAEQIAAWRAVAAASPLAMDAQANLATLLRRTEGHLASVRHLAEQAKRFPHHRPTVRAHLDGLRDLREHTAPESADREERPKERERAIRAFLAAEPMDAWGHRELALLLARANRREEALAALANARAVDARSVELHLTGAVVAESCNDPEAARAAFHAALEVDIDSPYAITRLVALASQATRLTLVSELFEQTERRAILGTTFEALYSAAATYIDRVWLSDALTRLRNVRGEVAEVWIVSIQHALGFGPASTACAFAEHAVARFPLVPEVHLASADAWSVAADPARAIGHLERAVELAPHLTSAVRRLANEREARGERDVVDALLERARRRAGFDTGIALEAISIRARRGHVVDAIRDAATLLEREPELEPAWSVLTHLAGQGKEALSLAVELAAKVAAAHPASDSAPAAYALLLLDAGRKTDAIAVLERAQSRGAPSIRLRDSLAVVYAANGRHADALAVCAPSTDEVASSELTFRRAWIHAHSGDLKKAIGILRNLLREKPALLGGWQRLIEWHLEEENPAGAVEAASRLVAIAPMAASSQRSLARALIAAGDRKNALIALARTIERDPSALDAAQQLFAMAVEDNEPALSRAALTVLERRVPDPERVVHDVQQAALERDRKTAKRRFRQACKDSTVAEADAFAAYEAMDRAGWRKQADEIVVSALAEPEANGAVGALWIRGELYQTGPAALTKLEQLSPSSAVGRSAAISGFEALGHIHHRAITRTLVRRLKTWLVSDDVTWSAPFGALVGQQSYWRAVWWGRNWHERAPGASRLHILGVAMHACGLRKRAMDLMRGCASKLDDAEAGSFHAWMAFDHAARGETALAQALLQRLEGVRLHLVANHPAVLADALVAIQSAAPGERRGTYLERRERIEATLDDGARFPSLRDAFGRFRLRLALDLRDPNVFLRRRQPSKSTVVVLAMGVFVVMVAAKSEADVRTPWVLVASVIALFFSGKVVLRALLARG